MQPFAVVSCRSNCRGDADAQVWDLREGQQLFTIHGHRSGVLNTAFSPRGDYFTSAGEDELVLVWNTNFDALLGERCHHTWCGPDLY